MFQLGCSAAVGVCRCSLNCCKGVLARPALMFRRCADARARAITMVQGHRGGDGGGSRASIAWA
eukprot:124884-Alexandrium_andersonii.AAC.1